MANGETTQDLLEEVLRRCGEVNDGTSEYQSTALAYLNKAQRSVIAGSSEFGIDVGEAWPWAFGQKEIILTLQAAIGTDLGSTATVNFTFNSPTITFSSAPVNASNAQISVQGWWIQDNSSSEWYYITQHTLGSTTATLDTTFNGTFDSNASEPNSPFICCQLDYTLTAVGQTTSPPTEPGGIMRLADAMEVYFQQDFSNDNEYKIYGSDIREFKRQYPLSLLELGVPTRFCITSQSNTGTFNVRFNKYIDQQMRVNVPYIPVPIDLTNNPDSVPVLPIEHRDVLTYIAIYWLMTEKHDPDAQNYLQLAQNKVKAMIMDARKKRDTSNKLKGVLVPRWDQVNQRKRILYF
jgi:hypothetical protein